MMAQELYGKPLLGTQIDFSHPLAKGLVGCWLMNETGQRVFDSSPYKNHGVLSGFDSPPKRGTYGLAFDGVDDYVDAGNDASLTFERTNPFSICAWIKKNDLAKNYQAIVSKMNNSWRGFTFHTSGSTEASNPSALGLTLSNANVANDLVVYSSDNSLTNSNWNHVCTAYTGNSDASGVSFYINGINQAKEIVRNGLSATILNSVNVEIGHEGVTAWPEYFNGYIDEVSIWNRALSANEIQNLYIDPYCMFNFNEK